MRASKKKPKRKKSAPVAADPGAMTTVTFGRRKQAHADGYTQRDQELKKASRVGGKIGGDRFGFKGGRRSKLPRDYTNHHIRVDYERCLREHNGDAASARKKLHEEL